MTNKQKAIKINRELRERHPKLSCGSHGMFLLCLLICEGIGAKGYYNSDHFIVVIDRGEYPFMYDPYILDIHGDHYEIMQEYRGGNYIEIEKFGYQHMMHFVDLALGESRRTSTTNE